MKEITPKITNAKHKIFINGIPLFREMSKKERNLFIAALESEIKDYYKDKKGTSADLRPP